MVHSGHAPVGHVVGLWRYPVKSMAGEAVEAADVSWHGLAGDRRWAFIRPGTQRSGFPWLTARELPQLLQCKPRLSDPAHPDSSPVLVHLPSGTELKIDDPALAALLHPDLRLLKQDRGIFDTLPLSLISTATVEELCRRGGVEPDIRRFRPNLVIESAGGRPFAEDEWVGAVLRIGELRIRVDKRDQRCVIVNLDPDGASRDPLVLRTIAQDRDACAGVYGSTVRPGRVGVGDEVFIDD